MTLSTEIEIEIAGFARILCSIPCSRCFPITALAVGGAPSAVRSLRAPFGRLVSLPAKWSRALELGLTLHRPVQRPSSHSASLRDAVERCGLEDSQLSGRSASRGSSVGMCRVLSDACPLNLGEYP